MVRRFQGLIMTMRAGSIGAVTMPFRIMRRVEMLVGVPKEIKTREFRVGLVPSSVAELVHRGHQVLVETNAGIGIGAGDDEYRAAGADIAASAADVFAKADMIVKVKEPQPNEWVQLSPNQILFTYLHLAADAAQAYGLVNSGCTAIAYETITDDQGVPPRAFIHRFTPYIQCGNAQ